MSDLISLAAALVGFSASLANLTLDVWKQRRRQHGLHEEKLEAILASPDLAVLGKYLDDDLGAIDVGRYATDADARRRVDRVLARLSDFLGPVEDIAQLPAQAPTAQTAPPEAAAEQQRSDAKALLDLPEDVRRRLDSGDEWAALVLLRSKIEHQIRDFLRARGEQVSQQEAIGKLVSRLRDLHVLEPAQLARLSHAISNMNRAAHGQEASADDVLETLRVAASTMGLLQVADLDGNQKTLAEAYGINSYDPRDPGRI
jgi:hypothetical protein